MTKSASGRVAKPAAPEAPKAPAGDVPAASADPAVAIKIQAPAVSQAPKAKGAKGQPTQTSTRAASAAAEANAAAKPGKSVILLSRFIADADHPFSPAGLREREKSARRLRLNAAASRKQRGPLRRAA